MKPLPESATRKLQETEEEDSVLGPPDTLPIVNIQASPTAFLRTTFKNINLPVNGHVIVGDVRAPIKLEVWCTGHTMTVLIVRIEKHLAAGKLIPLVRTYYLAISVHMYGMLLVFYWIV